MNNTLINLTRFHEPLKNAGLVPPHCTLLRIDIGATGALTIQYEVHFDAEQLIKLGVVFQQVGQTVLDGDLTIVVERAGGC